MSEPHDRLGAFVGRWTGESTLWLEPEEKGETSSSTATGAAVANGKFLRFDYTWSFRGRPQEGSLLVGAPDDHGRYDAVWIDSWHMGATMMKCTGQAEGADAQLSTIDVRGHYGTGGDTPSWGWRTQLQRNGDSLILRMWNVTPAGEEHRAVETAYRRE